MLYYGRQLICVGIQPAKTTCPTHAIARGNVSTILMFFKGKPHFILDLSLIKQRLKSHYRKDLPTEIFFVKQYAVYFVYIQLYYVKNYSCGVI